jgi:4-amino-4-deoxy-L-arabinose transferase-like glycosyltransferase
MTLSDRRYRCPLTITVLLLAAMVRLAYVHELRGTLLFEHHQGDAELHFDLARSMAAGNWLGDRVYYYAPLYPYVVAALFRATGVSTLAVVLFQVLLSVVDVWLIILLGRRLFDDRVGLVAGMLTALYGPLVFYTGFLLKETLGVVVIDAFLFSAVWTISAGAWRWSAVPGFLLGLTALIRPNYLPMAAIVLAWIWFEFHKRHWVKPLAAGCLFVVGMAAAVLPVTVRNYVVGKEWVWISAHGGHNFFIGNRQGADGLYFPLRPGGGGQSPYDEERDARAIAEQSTGRPLSAREVSAYWYRRGWDEVSRHPVRFVSVTWRKFVLFWNDYEVPDTQDFYFLRRQCGSLWLAPVTFGWIVPLAAVGLFASGRRWRACLPLYVMVLGVLAAVVPFFIFGRYRLPIVPTVALFAAAGVVEIARRMREHGWRGGAAGIAIAAACAVVVNWPIYRPSSFLATSYFNYGNLCVAAGRSDEAAVAWEQAVRLNPAYRKPRRALGEVYFRAGRFAEAAQCLSRAATYVQPGFSADRDATYMLGISYEQIGQIEDARRVLQIGNVAWPSDQRFADTLARLTDQATE